MLGSDVTTMNAGVLISKHNVAYSTGKDEAILKSKATAAQGSQVRYARVGKE